MNVAVLGASKKRGRYSNHAVRLLKQYGHNVTPIHPVHKEVEGIQTIPSVQGITDIHTLTIYMNPERQSKIEKEILDAPVKRIIFNPGTENMALISKLRNKGIQVVTACTLVMLESNRF